MRLFPQPGRPSNFQPGCSASLRGKLEPGAQGGCPACGIGARGPWRPVPSPRPPLPPPQASPLSGRRLTVRRGVTLGLDPGSSTERAAGAPAGSFPPAGGAAPGASARARPSRGAARRCRAPSASARSAGPAARPEGHGPDRRLGPGPARRARPQLRRGTRALWRSAPRNAPGLRRWLPAASRNAVPGPRP